MSFINFFRGNLAAARLAIQSALEYRTNFLVDALVQPIITAAIEATLWSVIVSSLKDQTLGGFGREYYLSYALWANFLGRITANWMYEYTMLEDIETGRVNSLLVRPISFYQFFLFQFIGYKALITVTSFFIPMTACYVIGSPMFLERLPVILLLTAYYLIFVHTLSFCVACMAFFLNRAGSFTMVKNIGIWVLAGELIPLDLYPEPMRTWLIHLPFAAGVYIPVGYITGRFGIELIWQTFASVTVGILVAGLLARALWSAGLRSYTGTGA